MSRKELPNPHLTFWKTIYSAGGLWSIFTFMNWIFNWVFSYVGSHGESSDFPPLLTTGSALMGLGWLLLFLWLWWAWRPRRKHARWHRWLASFSTVLYVSSLVLLGAVRSWNAVLITPWNAVINSLLLVLFAFVIILPVLSSQLSTKLAKAQDELGLKMLSYGSPAALLILAGTVGANYGRDASRHGNLTTATCIVALGLSLVAIFLAQYNAERLWRYRPWAKEEE